MANKRMLSMAIMDSDAFLDMPLSTQALYTHLCMRADDDGFIGNVKKIMRAVGAKEDDLNILLGKRFLLSFPNGVLVVKHWRLHNTIGKTRYHETVYLDEKRQLFIKADKSYSFTEGVPLLSTEETSISLIDCGEQTENKRRTSGEQTENAGLGLDIDIELEEKKKVKEKEKAKQTRFAKPTMDDLMTFKREHNLNVDCYKFMNFYESKGWMVGKNHMKDWKAAMRGWHSRENPRAGNFANFEQRTDDLDSLVNGRMYGKKEVDTCRSGT